MMQALAPWNPGFLSAVATELETEPFVAFSFANVDANGLPHTRTLIFRGFLFDDPKTNVLLFATDRRTAKYRDLCANPNFEACFYFHKLRKQFRFTGAVRFIDQDTYPDIRVNRLSNPDPTTQKPVTDVPIVDQMDDFYSSRVDEQDVRAPLNYRVISPSQTKNLVNMSFSSLVDINRPLGPPSEDEWKAERERCWAELSRSLKKSFKRPIPGTPLNSEKSKLLDSINRGVDGTSSGFENFAVVCMFVKAADQVDLSTGGSDHRYLYKKSYDIDAWKEFEVCP